MNDWEKFKLMGAGFLLGILAGMFLLRTIINPCEICVQEQNNMRKDIENKQNYMEKWNIQEKKK